MNFKMIEMDVLRWGEARGIIENSNALSQAIKTLEEVTELIDAIHRHDDDEIKDAIGDVLVTLTMVCAILDFDLTSCFDGAYMQIKDRKGYLRSDGVFVKETQPLMTPLECKQIADDLKKPCTECANA